MNGDHSTEPTRRAFGARRPWLMATLLAGVVLLGLTGASCGGGTTTVSLANASLGAVAELIDAPATVTARSAVTLVAPAAGTLAKLSVDTGDMVKAGRIVAVIDSPEAEKRLAQAKDALDAAKQGGGGYGGGASLSGLQTTNRAAGRAFQAAQDAGNKISDPNVRNALLAQARAAQQQYELAARTAAQAIRAVQRGVARLSYAVSAMSAAQRLQAQQAYDLAKSTVDALTLRAPISGMVQLGAVTTSGPALAGGLGSGAVPGQLSSAAGLPLGGTPVGSALGVDGAVPVGGRVAAGTPVLAVVDTARLGAVAEVNEADVLLVKRGLSASIEVDAAKGASYTGKVRSIDVLPIVSRGGGVSYRVRLTLDAGTFADGRAAPALRPGMSALARLRVRQANDAVTVPAAAVFSAEGRDAVWVVRNGRAERTDVTVGVQGQGAVQIVSGVRPGQQVVVRGTDQVRQGQQVS